MFARQFWNLVMVASVGVLVAVALFFARQYTGVVDRGDQLDALSELRESDGVCAAFVRATELLVTEASDPDASQNRSLDGLRRTYVTSIVGDQDARGGAALLSASADGLLDTVLCEQIRMVAETGEVHPALALLRFTHSEDPCAEPLNLDEVLGDLAAHRALLLRNLLREVGKLRCLSPEQSHELAEHAVEMLRDDATAFDDLDALRIAGYLHTWAPLRAAQVGCQIATLNATHSLLGNALGCTEGQRRSVLTRYRYGKPITAVGTAAALAADSEVVLLWQDGNRCEVSPLQQAERLLTVSCQDLSLVSGLEIAVLLDRVAFGAARADLISGLASYEVGKGLSGTGGRQPAAHSWYAHDIGGVPLGVAHVVSLESLAKQAGEDLPEQPLHVFCRQSGAKFCYDVDWSQLVGRVRGDPMVFFSRPADFYLQPSSLQPNARQALFRQALGREAAPEAALLVYGLASGGRFLAELGRDSVELRWQLEADGPWYGQLFGNRSPEGVEPAARLMAALDLQMDGRPEIIVQRASRVRDGETVRVVTDEIVLLDLREDGAEFETLTQLTVHEY